MYFHPILFEFAVPWARIYSGRSTTQKINIVIVVSSNSNVID